MNTFVIGITSLFIAIAIVYVAKALTLYNNKETKKARKFALVGVISFIVGLGSSVFLYPAINDVPVDTAKEAEDNAYADDPIVIEGTTDEETNPSIVDKEAETANEADTEPADTAVTDEIERETAPVSEEKPANEEADPSIDTEEESGGSTEAESKPDSEPRLDSEMEEDLEDDGGNFSF